MKPAWTIEELVDFEICLLSCAIALACELRFHIGVGWMFLVVVGVDVGLVWLHYNVFGEDPVVHAKLECVACGHRFWWGETVRLGNAVLCGRVCPKCGQIGYRVSLPTKGGDQR